PLTGGGLPEACGDVGGNAVFLRPQSSELVGQVGDVVGDPAADPGRVRVAVLQMDDELLAFAAAFAEVGGGPAIGCEGAETVDGAAARDVGAGPSCVDVAGLDGQDAGLGGAADVGALPGDPVADVGAYTGVGLDVLVGHAVAAEEVG